ncbi:MAG: 16S rRNA (guanine(527)-N(7))-methyltransferase RsmG [Chloroflexota bacterium]|nr:MAG: 16S rRNA (guanine(527)-N(7))-methyltransferase RsmG [Chloroflexota bacterium]
MSLFYQHARAFGVTLTPLQQELFEKYYRLLVEWNEKINLTTITEYTSVQLKHFLDSLAAAPLLLQSSIVDRKLIDVGAGAGFPGMPLAIAFPDLRVTLLEATGKKVRFLDHVTRELALENVTSVHARAEEFARMAQQREHFDFAVARALAPMPTLVEYTLPFVRVGGVLIAYKAVDAQEETAQAKRGIEILGGRLREIVSVKLGDLDDVRRLVVIDKIAPTPERYPRAGGAPKSKPL